MKKDYLKPTISIEKIELEDVYLMDTSAPVTGEESDNFSSKDREDFEGEGDSGWGNLW